MRQGWSLTGLLPALLILAVVPGCAPVTVRQTTFQSTYSSVIQADVISTGELSQMTHQVLRMAWLQTASQDPLGTFQKLDRLRRTAPDRNTQVALVELALWYALQQEATHLTAAAELLISPSRVSPIANRRFGRAQMASCHTRVPILTAPSQS